MDVLLRLPRAEIITLLGEVAPLRIHLTETDEDRRWVEIERPTEVSLVPGVGVRIVSSGRIRYEVAGISVPLAMRRLQLLFTPEVATREQAKGRLDFRFRVEEADLELVPGLVEGAIVAKVNDSLEPSRLGTSWDFMRSLSMAVALPERFEPLNSFLLQAQKAQVAVSEDALEVRLELGLGVSRRQALPSPL